MRFGAVSLAEAAGGILAHSVRVGRIAFKKGRRLAADDIAALRDAGIEELVVARLEPGDVGEDVAAARIGAALSGGGTAAAAPFTGRVNLFAEKRGLFVYDTDRLDALNLIDESVTLATLPANVIVEPRQMVATVKVIPFAAPEAVVADAVAVASRPEPLLRVRPLQPLAASLIQTRLPGLKESILDKTAIATRQRLEALGGRLLGEIRCDHRREALAPEIGRAVDAGAELVLIAGASAIVDRRDVIPAAIGAAGGTVEHYGMPVDPGNLMLLGRLGDTPVLGLPGCARSPKVNGFDWVLERLAAGLPVTGPDVMRMGAGGLLAEIPSRPLPRAEAAEMPHAPVVAGVLLAAGQASRMGGPHKLLETIAGKAMVRHAAETLLASGLHPVVAVLGREAEAVAESLADLPIVQVYNPSYRRGLSTSLGRGLAAVPDEADGVVVALGDMPLVTAAHIRLLTAAFAPAEGRAICVPTRNGRRGNPVLWARRFLPEMKALAGDTGAKAIIAENDEWVAEVEMPDDGVLVDIDTPEALAALRSGAEAAPR